MRQRLTDSAFTYRALAELEEEPSLAELHRRLAATEERHAELWAAKLKDAAKPTAAGPSRRQADRRRSRRSPSGR